MSNWRVIFSGENHPYDNMAEDEAILKAYRIGKVGPTLRIYRWSRDAISLGCFQDASDVLNLTECLEKNVPFVRRITGGEAIFHGNDLSYSITLSNRDLVLPVSVKDAFMVLTGFILNAYKRLGIRCSFFSNTDNKKSTFCFAKRQGFDIAVDGKKLGGNAQKRVDKNIVFQHGSIPFSLDAPKIKPFFREDLSGIEKRTASLSDILPNSISFDELSIVLSESFENTFGVKLKKENLTPFELKLTSELKREKYGNRNWLHKKTSLA
ncbi:MAG: biotin/lipoate A/B protein ligase family protein [Candidatus Omnitrophota bacterium]